MNSEAFAGSAHLPMPKGRVVLERVGMLARVTLEHEGKLNAMSRSMWRVLKAVFEDLQEDAALRCVIVQGQGGHFCAGGDISEYPAFRFQADSLRAFHEEDVWGGLEAMLLCGVPLIAQIEGHCMGAGLEIASCCDVRIGSELSQFGAPIARLGFPMAPHEAALVTAAVGSTTVSAMLLASQVFDSEHMLRCGFLTHRVADAEVATRATQLGEQIVRLAPAAARANKQSIRSINGLAALVESAQIATKSGAGACQPALDPYAYADSTEHREGIQAFIEKRKPQF